MRVLIGRTFKHVKEDKLFVKGKDYDVKKDLGTWISRKRLGIIIPEVKTNGKGKPHLKDLKGPTQDKMIKEKDIKTK